MQDFADSIHNAIAHISIEAQDDFPFRHHLGASVIGKGCDRYLWYSFRWARLPSHSSRIQRLFRRGHREEARIIDMLRGTGLVISTNLVELCENVQLPATPNSIDVIKNYGLDVYKPSVVDAKAQIKANLPPHLGGSMDGILHVPANYVGMFGYFMPVEIKTHNQRSFSAMKKNNDSIRWNVPQHFVQGNAYAVRTGCTHFLYVAENKNTDELYLKQEQAESSVTALNIVRAEQIIYKEHEAHTAKTAEKWQCRMCEYDHICNRKKKDVLDVAINCRTCVNARPIEDGTWSCMATHCQIEKETEIELAATCPHYESIIK